MRALFQILIGIATPSTVASSTSRQRPEHRLRRKVEEVRVAPARADRLAQQFERDRRADEHHLPVDLEAAHHLPRAAMDACEDERREVPDGFLRAELAQAAAGEPAADGEGERAALRR